MHIYLFICVYIYIYMRAGRAGAVAARAREERGEETKVSLSVPDLSKLGKTRYTYRYRTCTQTVLRYSLALRSYKCTFGTWWLLSSKGVWSVPDKLA